MLCRVSVMSLLYPVLYLLLLGVMFAAAVVAFWLRGRSETRQATLAAQLQARDEQLARQTEEMGQLKSTLASLQLHGSEQSANLARLETQLEEERKQSGEKLAVLSEARAQLTTEFQNLANKILEEKSKKFTDQNRANLDQVLNPLREQLGDFRRKVEDVYEKESKDRMSLFHEISALKHLNQQISSDAINLTNALKGQSKTQGSWGEVILERVLEESGLHKGREYDTQGSFTTDDGKRLRPDVVVHLPEGKDIIIDSKVSLTGYERYCSSTDEVERQLALREHVASLRSHIKGLSVKSYEDLPGINSLDFVLLFVPIEAAFITALENDQLLFREAFDKNIIVVSPTTLLATLRTVHNIWRYEYQNKNALEIAEKAGGLYDQFVRFGESLLDVEDKLGKAQASFQTAKSRLMDGRGNLVSRTQQLQKLGAKAKKKMPEPLLQGSGAELLEIDGVEEEEPIAEFSPPSRTD